MPTYEYECRNCGHHFEVQQRITENPLEQCPHCSKSSLQRGVGGGAGIQFHGQGFYNTDYQKSKPCSQHSTSCGCHSPAPQTKYDNSEGSVI